MFDEKQDEKYSNLFVATEEKQKSTNNQSYTNPQKDIKTKKDKKTETEIFKDDYSANQNFQEETNYDIKPHLDSYVNTESQQRFKPIEMPLIEKKVQQLEKLQEQPLVLNSKMKILLTSFIVIISSLIFAIVWNFVAAAKLNLQLENKSNTVSELQVSIKTLDEEYNILDNIDNLKEKIEEAGFIESNETNTITISLDEMYKEKTVSEIPSNWFNDVCNFISSIFK